MGCPVYWSTWLLQSLRPSAVLRSHVGARIFCESASLPAWLSKLWFLSQFSLTGTVSRIWAGKLLCFQSQQGSPFSSEASGITSFSGKEEGQVFLPWFSPFTPRLGHIIYNMESSPTLATIDFFSFTSVVRLSQGDEYRGCTWLSEIKENKYKRRKMKPKGI